MTVEELYQKVDRLVGDGHGPLEVMVEMPRRADEDDQIAVIGIGDSPDDGVIWVELEGENHQ